ncbi:hypothetical protein AOQ84DRAFT_302355 [Glonium stellatum]|uniref:Fungal N-terminal domain-containing protein n=1 Tax=Glonium stellatum TaxID=574774 RepID=A0A8E2ESQ9_9PEZI|nr:hypothetical protein AOQ84DRAFT_302355 [Glonium stellatum]
MPITFGSVGDIISLCGIIQNLVKALDDARGSVHEYRDIVEELRILETAIKEVKRLSSENSDVLELVPLFQTAHRGAAQCQQNLEGFLGSVAKYKRHFQEGGSESVIKANIAKAKWQIMQRNELVNFRAHISAHTTSMSVLLSALNM